MAALAQAPRFLVEQTLGRLARWLRLLGWEASLADKVPSFGRPGITILTRRRGLAQRPGVLCIESDQLAGQLKQVVHGLGLEIDPGLFFSRCLACGQEVTAISREEARGQVPDHVWHIAPRFTRCPGCGKIFWPGSHGARAQALLAEMLSLP
ncbi:hypothetical protein AAU61_19880 [Desulfocarbo indianensis]|nr:hypothetical protein AAU61_19880 [Desulfocarbo indianensis]